MISWNGLLFQTPNNLFTSALHILHDFFIIFLISTLILIFFSLFLASVNFYLFNYFTENEDLENLWTIGPFFILLFLIFPSLSCLSILESNFFCGLSVNIIAHQWYWSYFYLNFENWFFDAYISNSQFLRLIETDNRLLLPASMFIRCYVSSSDVLHSWAMPSLSINCDAIPGRITQFFLFSDRTGIFFGQCSEICGAYHSFMPIVVEFVDYIDFSNLLSN